MRYFVLLMWVLTALIGAISLLAWLRRTRSATAFPARLVALHIGTAVTVLACWTTFAATGKVAWAWAAFGVLNVTNGLGEAIFTGRFRALTGVRSTWWLDYRRAVSAVLKGGHPPIPALHGLAGGVTYFGVLVACLLST